MLNVQNVELNTVWNVRLRNNKRNETNTKTISLYRAVKTGINRKNKQVYGRLFII